MAPHIILVASSLVAHMISSEAFNCRIQVLGYVKAKILLGYPVSYSQLQKLFFFFYSLSNHPNYPFTLRAQMANVFLYQSRIEPWYPCLPEGDFDIYYQLH